MIVKRIHGETRRLGPPPGVGEADCISLSIRDQATPLGNVMWSSWEPTPRDLEVLAAGGSVFLGIYGVSHPMVTLQAGTHLDGDDPPDLG